MSRTGNLGLAGQVARVLETFDIDQALTEDDQRHLRNKYLELKQRCERALESTPRPKPVVSRGGVF